MKRFQQLTFAVLTSDRFFYVVVALSVFQALWLAFSALYPMAFDENFHFGLIKIYATQWSPFLTEIPPYSGESGAFTRDNSYFYHYLMSFPYRLIEPIIKTPEGQIIFLRLINIGFFTAGLLLFRKLLLKTPASKALVHFALLMLVLIPITPFLAAHINYDNLLFLLIPAVLLLTIRCAAQLQSSHSLPVRELILLASLCLFTSITKYAFLPIFLAIFLYLGWVIIRQPKKKHFYFLQRLWPDFKKLSMPLRIGLVLLLLIGSGLFLERYGGNVVQYHSLLPNCGKVVSIEHCSQYGPWVRNYSLKNELTEPPQTNLAYFNAEWAGGMMFRLFFAINADYNTKLPLPLPIATASLVALSGLVLVLVYMRRLLARSAVLLFLLIIGIYGVSIYFTNLDDYLELGTLTAVNGRYFIVLMPLIFIVVGLAFREALARFKRANYFKSILAVAVFLLFLQGGGLLTYLVRSESDWYWQSPPIMAVNETAKAIAETLVIFK